MSGAGRWQRRHQRWRSEGGGEFTGEALLHRRLRRGIEHEARGPRARGGETVHGFLRLASFRLPGAHYEAHGIGMACERESVGELSGGWRINDDAVEPLERFLEQAREGRLAEDFRGVGFGNAGGEEEQIRQRRLAAEASVERQ